MNDFNYSKIYKPYPKLNFLEKMAEKTSTKKFEFYQITKENKEGDLEIRQKMLFSNFNKNEMEDIVKKYYFY